VNLATRCHTQLAVDDNLFAGLYATLNNDQISLPLA
jgi:hypothetical protein